MELSEAMKKDLKRVRDLKNQVMQPDASPVQGKKRTDKQFDQIIQQVKQQRSEKLRATGIWCVDNTHQHIFQDRSLQRYMDH